MNLTLQPIVRGPRAQALAAQRGSIDAPASLLSITPLPEVTVLPPDEGWLLWDLAVRLRDFEDGSDSRLAA